MSKCIQCGKKRKPPKQFNYVSEATWKADEFCTAQCARKFHDIVEPKGHCSTDYKVLA